MLLCDVIATSAAKKELTACSVQNRTNLSSQQELQHRDFSKTVRALCGSRHSIDGKENQDGGNLAL
jgi:hypothetical protein